MHGNFNNKQLTVESIHESPMVMLIPLLILATGSIFAGFFFKDLLIGLEKSYEFWSSSIFFLEPLSIDHPPKWFLFLTPFLVSMTDTFDSRKIYCFSSLLGCSGLLLFSFFASNALNASICWSLVGAGLAGTYMPGLQILNSRLNKISREKYVAVYTSFFG